MCDFPLHYSLRLASLPLHFRLLQHPREGGEARGSSPDSRAACRCEGVLPAAGWHERPYRAFQPTTTGREASGTDGSTQEQGRRPGGGGRACDGAAASWHCSGPAIPLILITQPPPATAAHQQRARGGGPLVWRAARFPAGSAHRAPSFMAGKARRRTQRRSRPSTSRQLR